MSKNYIIKKEILNNLDYYFETQKKSFEARIEKLKLPNDEGSKIAKEHTMKFVRDKVLGIFKIGEIVCELINWNESVDKDIKEAKKQYLLEKYFEQSEKNEESLNQIKKLLIDPQGNTLFNKILRILDDSPPDRELTVHLSSALKYIVQNNFKELFDQHKYALSQIERLSPQALTILADKNFWPQFYTGLFSASGTKITSNWENPFVQKYAESKRISDQRTINRIKHSITELSRSVFIEAHIISGRETLAKCIVTQLGQELLPYIFVNKS